MRCRWFLFALVAVPVALGQSAAQPPITPTDGKWVMSFTLDPMAPPKPALKYLLLPDLRDIQSGNQIPAFYKCFMEQNYLFFNKESVDLREKWLYAPLADLAKEKELENYGGSAVRQAHHAARLDVVDWQITNQMKSDGINLLLPDVQQLRNLAAVLKVRLRGEIARGEFDNAIRTTQTLFALARSFNEHPTLIGHLVGFAIASITLDAMEEFVQQPGAPNLLWALAELPDPFISLRMGMHGERSWLGKEYDILRKTTPVSDAELMKLCEAFDPLYRIAAEDKAKKGKVWLHFGLAASKPDAVKAARERLTAAGHKADAVAKLSPLQSVMMDDFLTYESYRDELMAWMVRPYWEVPAAAFTAKAPDGVFIGLAPNGMKVKQAQARIQQRFAMLQVVEGLRAHAAGNGGKFPTKLDDVKLPLPVDPLTGKPFIYETKGGRATLRGTPPADRAKEPVFNRVYEIGLAK